MTLKPGARLRSQVCDTEIIVVSPPAGDVDLTCGGAPVVPIGSDIENYSVTAGLDEGNQLGKRYTAEDAPGLEVLVTKAGAGTLAIGTVPLVLKDAKPLPASD
ncbi:MULTISPECIES: hypothetical protein [Gordonia]|uniref:Uncharacterized protein n=1 Tax=Gordonia amicalis TaxID=89053 RepID=A0ABU4DDM2_9ACTN|nr:MULTISPECIES: hypothetical protein [Gordonia]ATD72309.1 hypothetical protein CNO18_20625 [Gordonia sp. 1D]MCR8896009.1 hypothetical protein [Gordonia sp. GONU]MCZ4651566.1 hypothetical protein [Gordonia amicalis]MDJ0452599.1 hypothetical protein [Gordonia amicalis]MDV6307827.1 hypothetical protein [Gordonia amicalis]